MIIFSGIPSEVGVGVNIKMPMFQLQLNTSFYVIVNAFKNFLKYFFVIDNFIFFIAYMYLM